MPCGYIHRSFYRSIILPEIKSHTVLIGLEIHVQLATNTKMFTGCANGATHFGAPPNSLVDEQILGLPGVLPVMNKRAVEYSIKVGVALGCRIAKFTKWDRKSYYYPDLPKNYQISQYDLPLCFEGAFDLLGEEPKTIRIRRAHLEEDAGKLLHDAPGGFAIDYSIVDLNRAGTPLLEIVTEPDFSSPRQVVTFAQELQKIVQYLGVSEGQMQMGHMRFEPNINLHITDNAGTIHKTAITEIKNLNSFSVLERASAYEIQRQLHAWRETGSLGKKSTYGWDEKTQSTFHQRDKEDANDYRYFPDPDLAPVEVSDEWLSELKSQVGELPAPRRARYISALGLSEKDATILTSDRAAGDFFERILASGVEPKRGAVLMETLREMSNEKNATLSDLDVTSTQLVQIGQLITSGKLAASKEVTKKLLEALGEPASAGVGIETIAQNLGLLQSTDTGAVDAAVDNVIASNPKIVADYKGGKQAAIGSLVGQVMKSTKGLNPKIVQERLKEKLA